MAEYPGSGVRSTAARIAAKALKLFLAFLVFLAVCLTAAGLLIRQASFNKTPYGFAHRADPGQLQKHVDYLCGECSFRNYKNVMQLNKSASYIKQTFSLYTDRTADQTWSSTDHEFRNVTARFGPEEGKLLVIGAHYDVCGDTMGADDDASGVAALLELARMFSLQPPLKPVELAAYSLEEPPFFGSTEMGSYIHAQELHKSGIRLRGMICLEMIGYFSGTQKMSYFFTGLIYPWKGNFIAVTGRWRDRKLANRVKAAIKGSGGVPVVSYSGPVIIGIDLSDQRNYWATGATTVMVTDTAFLRNPNYHTAGDTPDTLDYGRMAAVTDGIYSAAMSLKD